MLDPKITDDSINSTRITIYVGNLTMATTEIELRQAFEPFGRVMDVTILNDEYVGNRHPKFYAFIGMAGKTQGENAIASLDGKILGGQVLSVIGALRLSPFRHTVAPRHSRYGHKYKT